jgi:hypothetical protein
VAKANYTMQSQTDKDLMEDKKCDYGEKREMRVSSLTDLILLRVKQIEDNKEKLSSEGIDANIKT